jgi:hypothetical protein
MSKEFLAGTLEGHWESPVDHGRVKGIALETASMAGSQVLSEPLFDNEIESSPGT